MITRNTVKERIAFITPQSGKVSQALITILIVVGIFVVYHFFFAPDNSGAKALHDAADKQLKEQLVELQDSILVREAESLIRKDSIATLQDELKLSKANEQQLKIKLQNVKTELKNATDDANVNYYNEYINLYRTGAPKDTDSI